MKTKPYRRRSPTATAANQGSGTRKPIRQARRTAAATSTEDPIHRAIEEHRKAGQERYEIGRKPGRTDHDLDDAIANELDALRRLFNTAPATHDGVVALFRHCQTMLPGDYTTVIDEFVEMCVNGDEDKWSPTRWARMMELALRRIGPRSNQSAKPALETAGVEFLEDRRPGVRMRPDARAAPSKPAARKQAKPAVPRPARRRPAKGGGSKS